MRHRIRIILSRLGLLHTAISVRNAAHRCWSEITDRLRVLLAERRHVDLDDRFVHVVVPTANGERRAVPALIRDDHRASVVRAANRRIVTEVLDAANVDVSTGSTGDIVVPAPQAVRARAVLADARPTVFVADHPGGGAADRRTDEIVAFVHHTSRRRTATYGAECGVTVRFTEQSVAPPTHPFEIDIVYTWVDGSDPVWQRNRDHARRSPGTRIAHRDADSAARFRSVDELRYSLRSVERYAEFVRHIYIVTAGQIPDWLDTGHGRVTVVDHVDIFPDPAVLPTFNSHAIEACLHRIPGLSEHYLYLNDDFLFVRPVSPGDFFDEAGRARSFPSCARIPDDVGGKSVDAAAVNVARAVAAEFGVEAPTTKFRHAPYAQRIAVHQEIERRFPGPVGRTRSARFRSATDVAVASALHQHVAPLLGLGTTGTLPSGYAELGGPHLRERLRRLVDDRHNLALCLNDSEGPTTHTARQIATVHDFLETMLPDPSEFER